MSEYYIKILYDFLDSLTANNNREWFEAHRQIYESVREQWLADIDRMIAMMATWDPQLKTQTARSSAHRIYRDIRFSKDKTPYKTFFSATIARGGRKSPYAGYYIEIGNARFYDQGLYGGLWCPSADILRKMRHAIVDNIEEWEEIVNAPEMLRVFPQWCVDRLKTVPKGWERDHPQREYLQMTNYGKIHPCSRSFFLDPEWPERSAEMFSILSPLIRFLNYTIDE